MKCTKEPLNVAEVLERAANQIDACGWCQGDYRLYDGRMCALGAINEVIGCVWKEAATVWRGVFCYTVSFCKNEALREHTIAYLTSFVGREVMTWNDDREANQSLITSTLRAAALQWRAQHAGSDVAKERASKEESFF